MANMGDLEHGFEASITNFYRTRIDPKLYTGNKALGNKAIHRHEAFISWAFEQKEDVIIVAGHSLWFREFFKSFLPKSSTHIARLNKIVNCGCVAFDLYTTRGHIPELVRVDESSMKIVYKGFEKEGKKEKKA